MAKAQLVAFLFLNGATLCAAFSAEPAQDPLAYKNFKKETKKMIDTIKTAVEAAAEAAKSEEEGATGQYANLPHPKTGANAEKLMAFKEGIMGRANDQVAEKVKKMAKDTITSMMKDLGGKKEEIKAELEKNARLFKANPFEGIKDLVGKFSRGVDGMKDELKNVAHLSSELSKESADSLGGQVHLSSELPKEKAGQPVSMLDITEHEAQDAEDPEDVKYAMARVGNRLKTVGRTLKYGMYNVKETMDAVIKKFNNTDAKKKKAKKAETATTTRIAYVPSTQAPKKPLTVPPLLRKAAQMLTSTGPPVAAQVLKEVKRTVTHIVKEEMPQKGAEQRAALEKLFKVDLPQKKKDIDSFVVKVLRDLHP